MLVAASSSLWLCLLTMATSDVDASTPPSVWHWRNYGPAKPTSPVGRAVTIQVPPDTDIWRPAADKHNFTAPFLYTTLPTAKFSSAQVTVTAPWKTLYDQGGLVLSFPSRENANAARFIKAGVEFMNGEPALGVVGTDVLSDWSLSPIAGDTRQATILIERDGTDAWVYVLEEGPEKKRKRRALRQVTWAFNKGAAPEIEVGIYGAKPTRESEPGHQKDTIPVSFSGFVLNTVDGPVY